MPENSLKSTQLSTNLEQVVREFILIGFIAHVNHEDWGSEVLFMHDKGKAFARLFVCADDFESVYLNWLSVNADVRNTGIGTKLQEMRECIGREVGAKYAYLQVQECSWMQEWYRRRGYKEYECDNVECGLVWMVKQL